MHMNQSDHPRCRAWEFVGVELLKYMVMLAGQGYRLCMHDPNVE